MYELGRPSSFEKNYPCKSLFEHGNHQLKLITTALRDYRVGIQYISYYLDISLKMLSRCSIF